METLIKRYFCAEYAEYIRFYTRFFPGTFFDPPFSNSLNIQGALWDPILTQIGRNWNKWSQSQFSIPEYHRCKENVNWRRLTNNFLIMLSKGYRYLNACLRNFLLFSSTVFGHNVLLREYRYKISKCNKIRSAACWNYVN